MNLPLVNTSVLTKVDLKKVTDYLRITTKTLLKLEIVTLLHLVHFFIKHTVRLYSVAEFEFIESWCYLLRRPRASCLLCQVGDPFN